MPISMRCPGCQTRFDFADDLDGKRIKCKSCGDIFRVADSAPARNVRADDDDRPRGRRRDDDDDRPPSRYRRPGRDDESDDDRPRHRPYEDDDRPRPKKTNLLLIILPLALVGCVGVGTVGYLVAFRGDKKKGGGAGSGDRVVAPSRSCPIEVAEKDVGNLVLPDSGTTFGLLRKSQAFRPTWSFETYDLATGKAGKRIDLADVEEPKAWSLSPDGRNLLLTEAHGLGWAGDQWLWLWPLAGQRPRADKWFPYQRDDKRPFDAPALWRAEMVANDRVLTLGTSRSFFIYSIPTFETQTIAVAAVDKEGLGKRSNPPHDYQYRAQWEVAFTADRNQIAIWTGDGYTIANTADGSEVGGVSGVRALARSEWGNTAGDPNRVKGGPVAFSPDGSTLAAVIAPDFGNKRLLCLWTVADGALTNFFRIAENQWNEAASIHWWGNKFIATHGGRVDGFLFDVQKGQPRRQLMGPTHGKYGFSRDGKLWYAAGEDRTKPATVYVVDALDPAVLGDGDDYEQIEELGKEYFLRRLWLEPGGVLRQPTRDDPPIKQKLIRRP